MADVWKVIQVDWGCILQLEVAPPAVQNFGPKLAAQSDLFFAEKLRLSSEPLATRGWSDVWKAVQVVGNCMLRSLVQKGYGLLPVGQRLLPGGYGFREEGMHLPTVEDCGT